MEYDFYTVDSKEELSGLNGDILVEQTHYINDCIQAILRSYSYMPIEPNKQLNIPGRPTSVLLIGHSMGGLIASAVFTQPNYKKDTVNTILTLNTPHNRHPFLYRRSIHLFYESIRHCWNTQINSSTFLFPFPLLSFFSPFATSFFLFFLILTSFFFLPPRSPPLSFLAFPSPPLRTLSPTNSTFLSVSSFFSIVYFSRYSFIRPTSFPFSFAPFPLLSLSFSLPFPFAPFSLFQ